MPCATRSSWMLQPDGRSGKPSSRSSSTWRLLRPVSARNRRSKRNSWCWRPMKSRTVRQALLSDFLSPTAELLEEQRRGLRRTQEEHRVDLWDVEALVEEVDGEEHLDLAGTEAADRVRSRLGRVPPVIGLGDDARFVEALRHELRVRNGDAEPERPHAPRILDDLAHLPEHVTHPHVVAGEQVRQLLCRVGAAAPRQAQTGRRPHRPRSTGRGSEAAGRAHPRGASRTRHGRRTSAARRRRPCAPVSPSSQGAGVVRHARAAAGTSQASA
jgi:hypothetical protein